ncbi:MAG: hypothetical protein IKP38_00030 [Clostridia bacterium]|nr:hypothetical protein [Clostridia bacterium]
MKKLWILAIVLFCGLMILGCGDSNAAQTASAETPIPTETPVLTEAPVPDETPAPTEPLREEISLTWARAFRISTLPEGVITPDEIAFYEVDADKNEHIVNVPKTEVLAYRPDQLPRTQSLDRYIPDNLKSLTVTLDYALAHGYSRFSIPTTEFTYADILGVHQMLNRIYYIDGNGIGSLDVQSFETETGETLTYVLVTINGIPDARCVQYYLEGVAAAQAIVDTVPEGSTEFQTALYLYRYLADNVEYDYNDYYENGKQLLLYDALVKRKTVCAGYSEALYYLYNLAGIDCMYIAGYVSDPIPRGSHIWNVARIDGQYYQFDPTWDAGLLPSEYEYFAVSDDYMLENHTQNVETLSQEYAPVCPESLFPQIRVDNWESRQVICICYYYRFLSERESAPFDIVRFFGANTEQFVQTDTEDGWVVTDLEYSLFRNLLSKLMQTAEINRFCEGYYADRDGMLAFRKPTAQPIGWRLCGITENADGSLLAEAYRIDETGASQRVLHLFRFSGEKIDSVTEQQEGTPRIR